MKRTMLIIILGLVILVLVLLGMYKLMNARSFQLFGGLVDHVDTDQKVVALTFDDGPTEKAEKVLDILKDKNVKATFFVNGNGVKDHVEVTKNIIADGHELGNHTYSHPRLIFQSYNTVKREIERTDEWIRKAGYKGEILFRPPFGKKLVLLPYYLNQHDRTTIMWNIEPDSNDDISGDADQIIEHVSNHVEPGSILLLHVMYDNAQRDSLEALPGIIDSLKEKGYTFKTVSELLEYDKK